ncbi:hypothetical protein DEJ51_14075 [Streptomyces venezuelae]|uniref:Uncharacterized protein n=1 Tax=Streptomyces venezuelae TaxID=54571 RepID=A0A5P2DR41_STRVZ|nr:hypothetical protein DEJ51_14075 [Streptomyces venezuelae]
MSPSRGGAGSGVSFRRYDCDGNGNSSALEKILRSGRGGRGGRGGAGEAWRSGGAAGTRELRRAGAPEGGSRSGGNQRGGWGFPSVSSSLRGGPVPQGRSSYVVASLRDGLRPPLTDRPAPEIRRLAGNPQKNEPDDQG